MGKVIRDAVNFDVCIMNRGAWALSCLWGLSNEGAQTHLLHFLYFISVNVSAIMWNVNEDGLSKKIVNSIF